MGHQTTWQRHIATVILLLIGTGCNRADGPIEPSKDYSFDEMAAQLAAEEAVSTAEREK